MAGRPHSDLKHIIGMFVNTLPIRNYPKGDLKFKDFLSEIKTNTLLCLDNQYYQYEDIIDELKIDKMFNAKKIRNYYLNKASTE